jgi:hypothetical protein
MIGHAMDYPKLRRGLREHRRESGADGTRRATILLYRRRGEKHRGVDDRRVICRGGLVGE